MKVKSIINLIKCHSEKNELGFKNEVYDIAKDFNEKGDDQIAEYLISLVSGVTNFVPQSYNENSEFLKKIEIDNGNLWLPDIIKNDILGIVNAISRNIGVNKFLFEGKPGTGKTEASKQIARILDRDLYIVNFSNIIDSKLGETQKNIDKLFDEINNLKSKEKDLILFDEIDALALNRINNNDLREMGRATSTLLKQLDILNEKIIIIATTNLYKNLDYALKRRFDFTINFDRYSKEDMLNVCENITNAFLNKFKIKTHEKRIVRKIISLMDDIKSPGEMKNAIRTSIAFSSIDDSDDYLRKLYTILLKKEIKDIKILQDEGFTVREIAILTNTSKSTVSRGISK
ncbi:MAG: ATP-binding protein [Eubacteriales bacterium]|nr:ATP-binding protein [Eubacteriales bacterium]